MSETKRQYDELLKDFQGCKPENKEEFDRLLALLTLETLLSMRELLRDLKRIGIGSGNEGS